MIKKKDSFVLDVIIPVAAELDWPDCEEIVRSIRRQHREFGFTRFALAAPCGGWRSVGYPPKEALRGMADLMCRVKQALVGEGVECGWWITTTVKSGLNDAFGKLICADGSTAPFSSCVADPVFRRRFAEDMAEVAALCKPAFIITEDDYSVAASTDEMFCFCPHHLRLMEEKCGKRYTRETLVKALQGPPETALALKRVWREVVCDSLVAFAQELRHALDRQTPEIPVGTNQTGYADYEGDDTYPVAKAFAGERHRPFSRLHGAFYAGVNATEIPEKLSHLLYGCQHYPEDMLCYYEADTFPHTRYFTAGSQMRAMFGIAASYAVDGALFQTMQLLDYADEEPAYAAMFAKERRRLTAVGRLAHRCRVSGVEVGYDPFFNTNGFDPTPLWIGFLGRGGIPYTTLPSDVAFWEIRQARYFDEATVKAYLSKHLFLDGDAAAELCRRGFGRYLGVSVGDDVVAGKMLRYDLGAREVLEPDVLKGYPGRNMPAAHFYAPAGNGHLRELTVTDPSCRVLSRMFTFQHKQVTVAMTEFVNELGGHVVVMGMTLYGNRSQSLYNYRRYGLFNELLDRCTDSLAYVKHEPKVHLVMNRVKEPANDGFLGMLTLVNLGEDNGVNTALHLPKDWRGCRYSYLTATGAKRPLPVKQTDDGIVLIKPLLPLDPLYLVVEQRESGES